MAKAYRSALLTVAGSAMNYKSWSDKFVREEFNRLIAMPLRADFELLDPNDFTEQELIELGFHTWSEELPIRLVPLWFVAFMKPNIKLVCINGAEHEFNPDTTDLDHRGGLIAYGVKPSK